MKFTQSWVTLSKFHSISSKILIFLKSDPFYSIWSNYFLQCTCIFSSTYLCGHTQVEEKMCIRTLSASGSSVEIMCYICRSKMVKVSWISTDCWKSFIGMFIWNAEIIKGLRRGWNSWITLLWYGVVSAFT